MIDTGTATSGIRVVRSLPRNRKTTIATSTKAMTSVRTTSSMVERDEHRGIPEYLVCEVVGKALLQLVHDLAHLARHVDGVGAGRLVDADRRRRRAVEAAIALLGLGTEIDARHVLDPHDRAVGVGAHDDVVELVGPRQPSLGLDGELELLALRRRCRTDATERRLDVLALHGRDDVGRRQVEGGQPIGIEPQPQRIVERPEQGRLADAADARQWIDDVDGGVVVEDTARRRCSWANRC